MDKNKDEMIKDIARRILEDFSNYYSEVDVDAVKIMIGTLIDNLNYRKVGEDEVVVKKGMLIDAAKAFEELGNLYANGFVTLAKHHETVNQVAKETAREILQAVLTFVKKGMEIVASGKALANYDLKLVKMLEEYAEKYNIELE